MSRVDSRSRGSRLAALASCAAPMVLIGLGLFLGASDFARWDNLELFLPNLVYAHRRLLHGELPLWNPLQNLGEPIHAMGIAGVFYPPYTLCTGLVDAMGGNPRAVMTAIVVLHAGLAGLGLHLLCRSFGVRPWLANVAAVSGALCGFALEVGAVWIPVMPDLAWAAWSLLGAKWLVDDGRTRRGILVTALSVAMPFHTGHVQPALYNLLVTVAFAAFHAAGQRRLRMRAPALALALIAAILLAMPSVLPTAAILPDTERQTAFTRDAFGERGMRFSGLLGLVLPVYGGEIGFLDDASLASAHAGAWLVPAILIALVLGMRRPVDARPGRKKSARAAASLTEPSPPSAPLGLVLALAAIVIVLCLGNQTPLYGATWGIPGWSSFRWPFRLFLHAVPLLILAGAISLERIARAPGVAARRTAIAFAVFALVLWIVVPGPRTAVSIACGALGLIAIVCLGWLDRTAGRVALSAVACAGAGALFLLTHPSGGFKTYPHERPGSFDLRALGLSAEGRLLPLSSSQPSDAHLQDLGLFHSATINGYASLTGQRFAMTSMRLRNVLPTEDNGVLPPGIAPWFLRSHLMRCFGGRYALVAKEDRATLALMDTLTGYRRVAETPVACIFANSDTLPRMFFASEVRPFDRRELIRGLVENRAAMTCAFVEGGGTSGPLPAASVESSRWTETSVTARVTAPGGGFLVASMNPFPGWSVRIDGRPGAIRITDGALIGIDIPAGAREVELSYEPSGLRLGAWLAAAGMLVLAGIALFPRRTRTP